ncbi:MAG: hypothetical protein J5486_04190 [Bacteroidaceae bacterium]|nr:hypothetical protein [Bacteroidaceae bacterium]
MSKTISNRFALTAVINGMTLRAQVIRDTTSAAFFQFYDKDAAACIPDWSNTPFGPNFHVEVTDAKGTAYNPANLTLMWNGTAVAFGSADGNGVAYNTDGVLDSGTVKTWTENSVTYFQLVKNIFSSGNDDNDQFYVTGSVRLQGGTMQSFRTETENVTIIKTASGGTSYYVHVEVTDIQTAGGTGTCTAHLFSSATGQEVTSGLTYQWFNMTGTTAAACTAQKGYSGMTGKTLTVPEGEVNGDELFRVDITLNGKVYSGYGQMHDWSDPYFIALEETSTSPGHNYGWVDEDETVTVTAYIVDKEGTVVTSSGLTPAFTILDSGGNALTAGSGYTVNNTYHSVTFTYAQIVSAGGCVTGYATAES